MLYASGARHGLCFNWSASINTLLVWCLRFGVRLKIKDFYSFFFFLSDTWLMLRPSFGARLLICWYKCFRERERERVRERKRLWLNIFQLLINRYITPCSRTGSRCMKSNSCVVFVQCISVIATSLLASDWSDITVLQLPTWNNPIAIVNNYTIDTTFFRRKINVLYNRQYFLVDYDCCCLHVYHLPLWSM